MKNTKTLMTVMMIAAISATSAMAGFAGYTGGRFVDPVGSATDMAYLSGVGTNHIESGKPIAFIGSKTELTFNGTQFQGTVGNPFKLGQLCYYNGLSKPGTRIDGITLAIDTTFTQPEYFQDVYDAGLDFDFYLFQDCLTMNNAGVKYGIGDSDYCLEIMGFDKKYCKGVSDRFCVLEGKTDYANIYAKVTRCQVIPAPGAVMLAGIGIGIVGWIRKRKDA